MVQLIFFANMGLFSLAHIAFVPAFFNLLMHHAIKAYHLKNPISLSLQTTTSFVLFEIWREYTKFCFSVKDAIFYMIQQSKLRSSGTPTEF